MAPGKTPPLGQPASLLLPLPTPPSILAICDIMLTGIYGPYYLATVA